MDNLYTTTEAAGKLGCDPSRVRHYVRDARINGEPEIGVMRGRDRFFSEADIERMKIRTRGAVGYPKGVPRKAVTSTPQKTSRKRKKPAD